MNLEKHSSTIHNSPKMGHSERQVNVSDDVSEAEIEIRTNNYQIKLQPVTKGEIKEEHSSCETKIETKSQFIAEKEVEEKQFNDEQCGKQFPGKMHLEKHSSTIHDSPKMDHSGKQVNVSDNVSEAEIEIRRNNYRIELQPITKGEIKEGQFNCEQCGKFMISSKKIYLEEHRTTVHEDNSEKQVNDSDIVNETNTKSEEENSQNEVQFIAHKEIKQHNCEAENEVKKCNLIVSEAGVKIKENIRQNKLQSIAGNKIQDSYEIKIEKEISQTELQFIHEKEGKEIQLNCEQRGEQF